MFWDFEGKGITQLSVKTSVALLCDSISGKFFHLLSSFHGELCVLSAQSQGRSRGWWCVGGRNYFTERESCKFLMQRLPAAAGTGTLGHTHRHTSILTRRLKLESTTEEKGPERRDGGGGAGVPGNLGHNVWGGRSRHTQHAVTVLQAQSRTGGEDITAGSRCLAGDWRGAGAWDRDLFRLLGIFLYSIFVHWDWHSSSNYAHRQFQPNILCTILFINLNRSIHKPSCIPKGPIEENKEVTNQNAWEHKVEQIIEGTLFVFENK